MHVLLKNPGCQRCRSEDSELISKSRSEDSELISKKCSNNGQLKIGNQKETRYTETGNWMEIWR